MFSKEIVIPDIFYKRRWESIDKVLDYLMTSEGVKLFGNGIDVGPFTGTSVGVLEKRGQILLWLRNVRQHYL